MSAHAATNAVAVALAAIDKSHADVSRELGVARATVGHWRSGKARPRQAAREKLRAAYGIAVDAWDQALDAAGEDDAPKSRDAAPRGTLPAPEVPPYPECPPSPTPLQHARWSLACIAHDMQHRALPFSAVTKLRGEESRVLGLVAKLQQAEELSEDRYVREHAAWLELKRAILAALAPYPEASQAVLEAIKP